MRSAEAEAVLSLSLAHSRTDVVSHPPVDTVVVVDVVAAAVDDVGDCLVVQPGKAESCLVAVCR